jgi:hypothetical protein
MSKKFLDKEEAAVLLGISVRTLQRHMSARRIGYVMRPGKTGDEAMFDRAELRRFQQSQKSDVKAIVPPVIPSGSPLSEAVSSMGDEDGLSNSTALSVARVEVPALLEHAPPDFWSRLADKLAARTGAPSKPVARLSEKLMLTLREASVLSGISEVKLREAIEAGTLKRYKGIGRGAGKLRRDELERFVKKL